MNRRQVLECYEVTLATCFADWDIARDWKAMFGTAQQLREGNVGYCDSNAKTIYLGQALLEVRDEYVPAILIHELCHAVADAGHEPAWANEMEEAAKKAEAQNELLALFIRSEIYSYCNTATFRAATGLKGINPHCRGRS